MSRLTFWSLGLLCVAVEVLGLVIDRRDIHYAGAIAALGIIAVHNILIRAHRDGGAE
ncbi:hypothetical protein [Streptomyces sp. NPDC093600]|uniref:hypothetical protein n=1 Tax=Streptomyces sp. NPDC093600 TaxID=3366047 RepID=UPI0037FA3740